MNKASRMRLSFFMKSMNESELEYGLGIASFTTTPHGGLTTVLVVRYCIWFTPCYESIHVFRYIYIYMQGCHTSYNVTSNMYFQVTTMFHLDRPMYLLGYLASQSRVYLIDKEFK